MSKTKPISAATQSLLDAMSEDAGVVPEDKLERAKKLVRECRDLELANGEMSERIAENMKRITELKTRELVDMFDEVGIDHLGLAPEGNIPAYEIEIRPYYHANIKVDDNPDAEKAFAYLRKRGEGDMIKTTYTIAFGMGESKKQKLFESMLKKAKVEYSAKFGVPWNTLTAWLRQQVEVEKKTPPLDLLGATVGRRADVKKSRKQKESK